MIWPCQWDENKTLNSKRHNFAQTFAVHHTALVDPYQILCSKQLEHNYMTWNRMWNSKIIHF
jgi:hypothetical protein